MKEFEFSFDDGLKSGLRRFKTIPRNVETLIECRNWAPTNEGLEIHEAINLISGDLSYLLKGTGDYVITDTGDQIIL